MFIYDQDLKSESQDKQTEETSLTIESAIKRIILGVEAEKKAIVELFNENKTPNFWELTRSTPYSYFIFRNKKMLYWSDHHTAIESNITSAGFGWSAVELKSSVSLVNRSRFDFQGDKFEVFYVVPLYYDYPIQSSFLKNKLEESIFGDLQVEVLLEGEQRKESGEIRYQGQKLFSIALINTESKSEFIIAAWLGLLGIGIILLVLYTYLIVRNLHVNGQYLGATCTLLLVLLGGRYFMLATGFPVEYFELDLFDPMIYASSEFLPSFGDLLLNVVFFGTFLTYIFFVFQKSGLYHRVLKLKKSHAIILQIIILRLGYGSILLMYGFFQNLYAHSQIHFDITQSIELNKFKLFYLFVFILVSAVFFLWNYVVLRFLYLLSKTISWWTYACFGIVFVYLLVTSIVNDYPLGPVIIYSCYIGLVYGFSLFKGLFRFKYISYIYLVCTAIVCAAVCAQGLYQNSRVREYAQKQRYADQLIIHNDLQGEYLMSEVADEIKDSRFIKDEMKKPIPKDRVVQKIKRNMLNNYFDKYEVNVSFFDFTGNPNFGNSLNGKYQDILREYDKEEYKTENPELYFITNFDHNFFTKYLNFIEIKSKNAVIGYVIIEYTLKKFIDKSILPMLLQDQPIKDYYQSRDYNYAIYFDDKLSFSMGEYNYDTPEFLKEVENTKEKAQLNIGDYNHLVVRGINDGVVVVSSQNKRFYVISTNFSFLFLVLVLFTFVIVITHTWVLRSKKVNINFTTKIQTYLNIAYFLPLTIISVAMLGIISRNYQRDLKEAFKGKAENLSTIVNNYLEEWRNGEISTGELRDNVKRLTKYTESDITLFRPEGAVFVSSQPLIYESKLISSFLNPKAMEDIVYHKHRLIMLEESIGDFKYNSFYIALNAPQSGDFQGVLNIPFFNSRYELEAKSISVLSAIMNVFTAIFLFILVLSFFAFKALTDPLKLIAQKLKRTTFGGENEMLEWGSNDEIGMLVTEYNEMLVKLDESKKRLSRTEKEMAWKEMAKQVAHEIKNPLTPMKLKLQHLLRTFNPTGKSDEENQRAQLAITSIIEQVDTLSDIATSFSSFAKMPTPVNNVFDVTAVLKNTVALYENNVDYKVKSELVDFAVMVDGDEKLMGRIFTNLILNGIQSVEEGKVPEVKITTNVSNGKIILEFKDNGQGIPDEIKRKVFLPNFSTKITGSGVGLAVAKRGVEHAGGEIWFETTEGRGTSFFVELPLAK